MTTGGSSTADWVIRRRCALCSWTTCRHLRGGRRAADGSAFFPEISSEFWAARPELFTSGGALPMSAGGLLIEREGITLLIDAGVGPTSTEFAMADIDCGAMIDVLEATGHRPEDIDVVAFTHLHFDHAGWAYANGDKTFPNARYVVAAKEWAPYANGTHRRDSTTPRQVVMMMAADEQALTLIDDGDEIAPGVTPWSRRGIRPVTPPT